MAFIAALAITGSPRQAARHVGRAQYGAEQLRTAKGGRGFAAAWDAAMELARDRELGRLHDNLGELARKTEEANARAKESGRLVPPDEHDDGEDDGSYDRHIEEVRQRLFEKLQRLRRRELIEEIIPFPEKRAAWIVLNGSDEIEAIENGTWEAPGWEEPETDDDAVSPSPTTIGDPPSRHSRASGNLPAPTPPDTRSSRAKSRGAPPESSATGSSRPPGPRLRRL